MGEDEGRCGELALAFPVHPGSSVSVEPSLHFLAQTLESWTHCFL